MKEDKKFRSLYEKNDIESIPAQLSLNEEEKKYLEDVISSVNNLIAHRASLAQEERRILGPGKFFWPKDPAVSTELIRYYDEENFRLTGISLTLKRKNRTSEWSNAVLTFQPRNFPYGRYMAKLPETILEEYVIENVAEELRENAQVVNPTVYHFTHKVQTGVVMKVESQPMQARKSNDLPNTFYALEISRN
ncbi:hypothetical protein IM543_01170 [Massilia sp. UMI-21]|nr:hypothetical protein IM543_01170 [Massilia sp. UMI-21]